MRNNCIFCNIADGKEDNVLYYEDDDVVVFEDIRPAAKYHLLAIPKEHIKSVGRLKADHKQLVRKLERAGDIALVKFIRIHDGCIRKGSKTPISMSRRIQRKRGFHKKGYISVPHLHMHVVAPVNQMDEAGKERIFGKGNFRFVSV